MEVVVRVRSQYEFRSQYESRSQYECRSQYAFRSQYEFWHRTTGMGYNPEHGPILEATKK